MEENFDSTLTVFDEDNNEIKVEVLDIFELDNYPGKKYILYTKNETEGEYVKTYASIINQTDEEVILTAIEDETEFAAVQAYINSSIEEGE